MTGTRAVHEPVLLGLAVIALISGACAAPAATRSPLPTWPVPPEVLPEATAASGEARLTCGGRTFPAAALGAPTGAEDATGPEFDALRAAIAKFGAEFPGSDTWTWRLAERDDTGATFLAETDDLGPPGWVSFEVTTDGSTWTPVGGGQCDPHVVLSAEYGPASWALDPAYPAPDSESTELHILVWERSCSGGSPATGRMSAPVIEYSGTAVQITIGVRPVPIDPGTAVTCPMPPGTPAIVRLAEALGDRTLLDGGVAPPAPPSPANS